MKQTNNAQPARFYGLDHLRALAIIMVFAYHYCIISDDAPSWLNAVSQFGWTGVDLFFVLSGFLIASHLFSDIGSTRSFSYRDFFIKRCFRILPAYWLVLIIYFCFPSFHEREALPALWRFLTFTQNIGLNIKNTGTFSHAWSLCVEEHFYFLLPLSLLLLLKFPKSLKKAFWILPLLFLAAMVMRYYSYQHFYLPRLSSPAAPFMWYQYIYYPTWCRFDGLIVGVSIAALYQFAPAAWEKVSKLGNWLLFIAAFIFTISFLLGENIQSMWSSVLGFSLIALGYGMLVMAAISKHCFLYHRKSRTTAFIAAISYAAYLTHKGIIHLTRTHLPDSVAPTLIFLGCIITCAAIAYLVHLTVEKTFLRWRNRLLKTQQLKTTPRSLVNEPLEIN